jgi:ribosome-interacting GTPase 1
MLCRLNQKPAEITFQKKEKGGVNISKMVKLTHLDEDTIKAICKEYRVPCANITFRCNATADELIDTIEGNRVYMPCIYVLNKIGAL